MSAWAVVRIINTSCYWRPVGGLRGQRRVDRLKKHMRNLSQREIFERSPLQHRESGSLQIPALKLLFISSTVPLTASSCVQKQKMVPQRWREPAASTDTNVSQPGLCSSTEMLIRLIQKSSPIFELLHKLEDEEHFPPLLLATSSLAFVAARQSSSVLRSRVRIEWSHKPEEGLDPRRNMKKTCFLCVGNMLENLIRTVPARSGLIVEFIGVSLIWHHYWQFGWSQRTTA